MYSKYTGPQSILSPRRDLTYDNRGGNVHPIDGSVQLYRSVHRHARREGHCPRFENRGGDVRPIDDGVQLYRSMYRHARREGQHKRVAPRKHPPETRVRVLSPRACTGPVRVRDDAQHNSYLSLCNWI